MLKIIDRQMVLAYFKAYFVCLTSLLSLYVVVDLFMNLDNFSKQGQGLGDTAHRIGVYYGYRVSQIFDRLCEAIVLLAGMFTVTWMQRNNEQVPLLSAGVSTQRIVLPVLVCATIMLSLTMLNQELLIPRIAYQLSFDKDDPAGEKPLGVKCAYEPNGILLEGDQASRKSQQIKNFRCTIPENLAGNVQELTAAQASYVSTGPRQGYWELTGTKPADLETFNPNVLQVVDSGRYILHTQEVDFHALTRDPNWYLLASTSRIYQELQKAESNRLTPMAVLFHTRLVRPILGLLLVFMGLSIILRDQNRNVFVSAGFCLGLCGLFFASCYSCKMLGDNNLLSPVLSAWLPVLIFGPFSVVYFDAVHT